MGDSVGNSVGNDVGVPGDDSVKSVGKSVVVPDVSGSVKHIR